MRPFTVPGKKRRRVIFNSINPSFSHSSGQLNKQVPVSATKGQQALNKAELSRSGLLTPSGSSTMPPQGELALSIPSLFTDLPPIRDLLNTETSTAQDATVLQCLPFLKGTVHFHKTFVNFNKHGLPRLERKQHIAYLHDSLGQYPAGYVGVDSSRPWMLYWALTGLSLLGEDVSLYRERCVFLPLGVLHSQV